MEMLHYTWGVQRGFFGVCVQAWQASSHHKSNWVI